MPSTFTIQLMVAVVVLQVVVIVMSLGFILFVTVLHIIGKVNISASGSPVHGCMSLCLLAMKCETHNGSQ